MAARLERKSLHILAGVVGVLDVLLNHSFTLALGARIYQASS